MGSAAIDRLTIEGYKSIRSLKDFKLNQLNILIGANGAGKSNFISFFRLLKELAEERLQLSVSKSGGADNLLYMGPKVTEKIIGHVYFGNNGYKFSLEPTVKNRFVFSEETLYFDSVNFSVPQREHFGSGHEESKLKERFNEKRDNIARYVYQAISSWIVYHFHDTGETAAVKRRSSIRDNEKLRPDASNLAAFLYKLQSSDLLSYNAIRDAVRLVAPFFNDFKLRPVAEGSDEIELEWIQYDSDYPFHASQLSDGTLRFICLATALLQPNPTSTVLIDEPELGLHPYALTLLSSLLRKASVQTQIIVSTQSASLLDYFEPENIIVVNRNGDESLFIRPDINQLKEWLNEYSLGELWQKNILGGRPK